MIDFVDRIPAIGKENMKKIKYSDGREETVTIVPNDGGTSGTAVNRVTLMAMQGMTPSTTVFNDDGTIVTTNVVGHTTTIKFNADGTITETFVGSKTLVKTTTFNNDGTISETMG